MTQKEKILNACKSGGSSIPKENLMNFIHKGVVKFEELKKAGLKDEIAEYIAEKLNKEEDDLWRKVMTLGTLDAYNNYLSATQLNYHTSEAKEKMLDFDDVEWRKMQGNLSTDSLNNYLKLFPDGLHVDECRALLDDIPWLEAKGRNTIDAYVRYMNENPNKHVAEAQIAISAIEDDNAWANACTVAQTYEYRNYLNRFPNGKHAYEAQSRINARAAGEQFLRDLEDDPNKYSADDIKKNVGNGVVSWNDIERIFGPDKARAIKQFGHSAPLPISYAPEKLQPNTTEVYFWGTPGSGKTCALGTIISSANRQGVLEKLPCDGRYYMDRLSNIFVGNSCCILPDSTDFKSIQEMIMHLTGSDKLQHKMTLIDLAGELFRSVYKAENKLQVTDENRDVLNKAMNYLKDKTNNKIHFFVVEYGAHEKRWEGLRMSDYLDLMMQYLKKEHVFSKSTVGVYVLVTKCDKMRCAKEDRPRLASEYVKDKLASFWNVLVTTCEDAAIKDLKTLSFSIGEVFAQQLCVFDGTDTKKVIDKLTTKTPAIRRVGGWLSH